MAASLLSSLDALQRQLQESQARERAAREKAAGAAGDVAKAAERVKEADSRLLAAREESARLEALQARTAQEAASLRTLLGRKDEEVRTRISTHGVAQQGEGSCSVAFHVPHPRPALPAAGASRGGAAGSQERGNRVAQGVSHVSLLLQRAVANAPTANTRTRTRPRICTRRSLVASRP